MISNNTNPAEGRLKQFDGMDVIVGDGMKEVKFPQFAKHPFPSVVTFVP